MAIPVKHADCCLYTFASGSDSSKSVVASSLTGERVYVQRADAMIENGKHYTLEYGDTGRAVLLTGLGAGDSDKVQVSDLGFKKKAVCNTDGRIAIQDRSSDPPRVFWIDKPEEIAKRVTRTINITEDLKLVFVQYCIEKDIGQTRLREGQHIRGASVFWEVRTIKKGLVLQGPDDDEWVSRNFKSVLAQWEKQYGTAVGVSTQSHFMVSEKAWNKAPREQERHMSRAV